MAHGGKSGAPNFTTVLGSSWPKAGDTFPVAFGSPTWTSSASGGATGNHATGSGDVHETLTLPSSDVTRRHAIPVTTPTRTLVDVARYAAPARLEEARS